MKVSVPLNRIKPNPWQTRIAEPGAEHIKDLALDIARNGLLQTPVGRLMSGEEAISEPGWGSIILEMKFQEGNELAVQLAFGHNRLAAYRWLEDVKDHSNLEGDYSSMAVEVRDLTDEQMANLAWSENEKRRDVTPIERAKAIQKRLDDFKWTYRQAAEALGIDHSTISNILRLLKLPEDMQKVLQEGEMTERQAGAILALFELPAFEEKGWSRKSEIISAALRGESSDFLRMKVEDYLTANSKKLAGAEFGMNFAIPEEGRVYHGLCETCDKRYKNRNLCFGLDCFEAKTEFVRSRYLEEASFISGYPVLDWRKGGNPSYIPAYLLEKIKATKCPNLVLAYGESSGPEHGIDGFPQAHLVCEKRNQSCSCQAGLAVLHAKQPDRQVKVAEESGIHFVDLDESDGDESEAVMDEYLEAQQDLQPPAVGESASGSTAKELEEAARQMRKGKREALERRVEIQKLVQERLVEALREDKPGVFYLIAHHEVWLNWDEKLDLEKIYQEIAWSLCSYPVVPSNPKSLQEMMKSINDALARLQLEPISLEKTLVEMFEAEEAVDG